MAFASVPNQPSSRPRPLVLQPAHCPPHRSLSKTSASGESSNTSSSNSFQLSPTNISSDSSHSSAFVAPLPKGARPPSPQFARALRDGRTPHNAHNLQSNRIRKPRPTSSPSAWRVEWRGISKLVKWALHSEKPRSNALGRGANPSRRNYHGSGSVTSNSTGTTTTFWAVDRSLPPGLSSPELNLNHLQSASPTSPLSPTNSTSCVDLTWDSGPVAQTEIGHGTTMSAYEYSGDAFPNLSYLSIPHSSDGRLGSNDWMRAKHVQSPSDTNVLHASQEQGDYQPNDSLFDAKDSDVGLSERRDKRYHTLNSRSSYYPNSARARISQSDTGHGERIMFSEAHPSAISSSSLRSDAHLPFPIQNPHPLNAFRSVQSAFALPINANASNTRVVDRPRPRKLWKSMRMPSGRPSDLTVSTSMRVPSSHEHVNHRASFYSSILSAPLVQKPPPGPRSPKKLTKKSSHSLPPIPIPTVNDYVAPPPVPPKPQSILKNRYDAPLPPPPPPPSSAENSVDSTMPTLTNSSESGSHDDNLLTLPQYADEDDKQSLRRPSFLSSESSRRWTVAVAEVPDDLFVEELERLRRMGLRAGELHGVEPKSTYYHSLNSLNTRASTIGPESGQQHLLGGHMEVHEHKKANITDSTVVVEEFDVEDEMEWIHARRAILCCRELVRTERSYQARLQDLADGNVSDVVPALSHHYLPALLDASKLLSSHLNEDMSALGVSDAFLSAEPTLEAALVAWCGVVGEFFGGKRESRPAIPAPIPILTLKRGVTMSNLMMSEHSHNQSDYFDSRRRHLSAHESRDGSALPAPTIGRTMSFSAQWLFRPAFTQPSGDGPDEKDTFATLRRSFRRSISKAPGEKGRRKPPPFRELAILPTQRVTRYVLLYKDLLKHTPVSSPAREVVEKAVDAANRLAQKCDRAQGNASFVHG